MALLVFQGYITWTQQTWQQHKGIALSEAYLNRVSTLL